MLFYIKHHDKSLIHYNSNHSNIIYKISGLPIYHDHLKFCVVCINSRRYVCCSECNVVSNECNEPTPCIVQPIGAHCCEVMYFWCLGFRGEFGFLNYDDVCICVVNKQF